MLTSAVEVLWTARYDYQPSWKLERHKHEYFQIIYFLGGRGRFFLHNQEYPISAGDLFLIKPQQYHGLNVASVVKTLDIKFLVKDARLKRPLLKASHRFSESDPGVASLFERIRREGENKTLFYQELCGAYLVQMLILLLRHDGRQPTVHSLAIEVAKDHPEDGVSRRVLAYIREHHAEDLSLQQIARALGFTDRHIRQKFSESVGVSPMRYLLQYRVEKAKELISYSDYALKEIAELAGFKSIHHFTRVFGAVTGTSPAAWRRTYREGICKDVGINPRFSNVNWTIKDSSASK
jgi:AraC-like DNA-binding protein